MAIISKPHRDRRHGLRPSELYLGLWIILLAPFCSAHPKTDSITLVNGNNITCEIQSLSRGMLNAKTDSLSSISIRWQDVTRVRSEYVFEIILTDGTRLYRVLTPDPNGNLEMTGAPAVPLINVVSLTPISSRIASRFDGSFDLGYNYQKSDSTTQLNADGDVRYTTRRRSLELQLSSTLVKRDMTATTSRNQDTFILNNPFPQLVRLGHRPVFEQLATQPAAALPGWRRRCPVLHPYQPRHRLHRRRTHRFQRTLCRYRTA